MKHKIWYRLVSMVLVLQMCGAPVALAGDVLLSEVEGVGGDAQVEIALPDPDPAPQPPIPGDGGADPLAGAGEEVSFGFCQADFSMGLPLLSDGDPQLDLYHMYFGPETTWETRNWGVRKNVLSGFRSTGPGDMDYLLYQKLPSAEAVGRVPDLQFAGFYVYDSGGFPQLNDENAPNYQPRSSWRYEDILGIPFSLSDQTEPTEEVDWSSGASTNTGKLVELAPRYGNLFTDAYDFADRALPIVGRWAPSDRAQLTALALETAGQAPTAPQTVTTANTEAIAGKNTGGLASCTLADWTEDTATRELWLRVPGSQETLNLDFTTFEPYYAYHESLKTDTKLPCPVSITAEFGETAPVAVTVPATLSSERTPEPEIKGEFTTPQNSIKNPARAQWHQDGIPLTVTGGEGKRYTTITVTITAPDGTTLETYTLHVQRMADPTLTQNPGNTPKGMIARDTSAVWGTAPEERTRQKAAAAKLFETSYKFDVTKNLFPQDTEHHQAGSVFKNQYTPDAWPSLGENHNLDLAEGALVVYQDTAFLDPGISLTDSEGEPLVFGTGEAGDYVGAVERTVQLRTADWLSTDLVGAGKGRICYYAKGDLTTSMATETLVSGTASDLIDLRGEKVLPGIYTISYRFTDPLTGVVYDEKNPGNFQTNGRPETFTRPLVVLPVPGDVDMDGEVTMADSAALKKALNLTPNTTTATTFCGEPIAGDPVLALFAYRVCDRDYNGALTQDDILKTTQGFHPALSKTENGGCSDYYYLPLSAGADGGSLYARKDWAAVTQAANGAALSLDYLGVETGTRLPSGVTTDPSGPWGANGSGSVMLDSSHTGQGDTFWLGVKLSDVAASPMAGKKVSSLTFSITYDSRYVEPATVYTQNALDNMVDPTERDKWVLSFRPYSLLEPAANHTIWGNAVYEVTPAATKTRGYTTHYSKVISNLEQGVANQSYLREMVLSVELKPGQSAVALRDGYLMAVPFRLVQFPFGVSMARVVELSAGMRELTLVEQPGPVGRLLGAAAPATAAAYSTQDDIFGSATRNLRQSVRYEPFQGVPLGKDTTERVTLYNELGEVASSRKNAKYSNEYLNTNIKLNGDLVGELPPGLTYVAQKISGVPTCAGEYTFSISGTPFLIVVEKMPLHYRTTAVATYYGETEYREGTDTIYRYNYDETDIQKIDRDRASANPDDNITLRGSDGTTLFELLGGNEGEYTQPSFLAVTPQDAQVLQKTPVGQYEVKNTLLATAKNYQLIFDGGKTSQKNLLDIVPRPVQVGKIYDENNKTDQTYSVGETYNDGNISQTGLVATWDGGKNKQFTLAHPEDPKEATGTWTGPALVPGDKLQVSFTAQWQRTAADMTAIGGFFDLEKPRETRPVVIGEMAFRPYGDAANYKLVSPNPVENYHPDVPKNHSDKALGTVVRREITGLTIDRIPEEILKGKQFTYGNMLESTNSLVVTIQKGGQAYQTAYNPADFRSKGIHVNWVTAAQKEAGEKATDLTGTGRVTSGSAAGDDAAPYPHPTNPGYLVAEDDGKYLCVSVDQVGEDGTESTLKAYAAVAIRVAPLKMTLEAQATSRFYGEENGALTYRYDVNQLANVDKNKVPYQGAGTQAELEAVLGADFTNKPQITTADKNGQPVTSKTPCGQDNKVCINGAASKNYVFQYLTSEKKVSDTKGDSLFHIVKRPVVVEEVKPGKNLATLYADTKKIAKTGLKLAWNEVTVGPPRTDGGKTYYYPAGGSGTEQVIAIPYHGDAVLSGEESGLSLTYTATVLPDNWKHNGFTNGYFDMKGAVDGKRTDYRVQVGNLALTGANAGNYELVYRTDAVAKSRAPAKATQVIGETPEVESKTTYFVSGTGTVLLRPIEKLVISSPPKMEYTYGEPFDGSARNSGTQKPLTVQVQYEKKPEFENDPENVTTEDVIYRYDGLDGGKPATTFSRRGFTVGYLKQGDTLDEAYVPGHSLGYQAYLDCVTHDGARLFVTGRRGDKDPVIMSTTTETFRVIPRPLTLTAGEVHRFYGEENSVNGPFNFTFDEKLLAQWEQKKLTDKTLTGADGDAALVALGLPYEKPTYESTAAAGSDVAAEGYPLSMSGGSLANYSLSYRPGNVFIYPRPVRIGQFMSDADHPIYTIYTNSDLQQLYTNIPLVETMQNGSAYPRFAVTMPDAYDGITIPGTEHTSKLTKTALVAGDDMNLKVRVQYPLVNGVLPPGEADKPWDVKVNDLSFTAGHPCAKNYTLAATSPLNDAGIGKVSLRGIKSIEVIGAPNFGYTYGEAFSLNGLAVRVTYHLLGVESGEKIEDYRYQGQAQFESLGLFVNYYDGPQAPTSTEDRNALIDRGRKADSGDHLTIAPSHDNLNFKHDGQKLIVSGRLHHTHVPVTPQVVSGVLDVKPLELQYTLAAGDKTYDGSQNAVGTVALKNTFHQTGYVDPYNRDVTDVVYVTTGAPYEGTSNDHNSYGAFKTYVAQHGYSFTTGTYTPNAAAPLGDNGVLGYAPGYKYGTGLTFTFANPNVHYEDGTTTNQNPAAPSQETYWRANQAANTIGGTWDRYGTVSTLPVEVTGMALAGPDAANYTWKADYKTEEERTKTEVLLTSRDTAQKGQDPAPYATIHKRNRVKPETLPVIRPQVAVDRHSNVARISFDQQMVYEAQESPDYKGETHFEYALQCVDATGTLRQWAGEDGGALYQDTIFFGGEAVAPKVPDGYVPTKDKIPDKIDKTAVIKGQRYRWAGEDLGFTLDGSAYPGGNVYPGYELYKTTRAPLPKNAVLIPVVRVSETHNYHPSPTLTSHPDVTPELEDAWQKAKAAAEASPGDDGLKTALEQAASALKTAASPLILEGTKAANDRVAAEIELAKTGKWAKDEQEVPAAPSFKTYRERLDLISVSRERSATVGDSKEYLVPTLESVWFTDLLEYPEQRYLDAVVRNNDPVRYYSYYWDGAQSAPVDFSNQKKPIDLTNPIPDIEVDGEDENGRPVKKLITVNENNNAVFYTVITPSGGGEIRKITLTPDTLKVKLGDAPVQITCQFSPASASRRTLKWTTSNAWVATVSDKGLITFTGVGTAVITATTHNKKTATVTVTVLDNQLLNELGGIFDFLHTDAWFKLDENGMFHPDDFVTRGDMALILGEFYVPSELWNQTNPGVFEDLKGDEPYAASAALLREQGVLTGTEGGQFAGEQVATRAEFVTLVARMIHLPLNQDKRTPGAFQDTSQRDTWAYAYINAMYDFGVLRGVGDDRFAPGRGITKSETAAMLARLMSVQLAQGQGDLRIPVDVPPEHWAYLEVLRALNAPPPPAGDGATEKK